MNSTTTCSYHTPLNAVGVTPETSEPWQYSESVCIYEEVETITPFQENGTRYVDTITGGEVLISFFLLIFTGVMLSFGVSKVIKYNLHKKYMGNNSVDGKEFYDI